MRAVFFDRGRVSLGDVPRPAPGPGLALLRLTLAGICNTDIELSRGYYTFSGIPGHEFTAVVAACPDDPSWVGQRVASDINVGCGHCPRCASGDPRHCPGRTVIGIKGEPGAFAEYLTVPIANLHRIPDQLPDEAAVFAEPLAAALEIGRQIDIPKDASVAVLGDGKLGLLCALALGPAHPGLVLIGRHQAKLALARNQGINTLRLPRGAALPGELRARFDLAVEATGSPGGINLAMDLVRPEATVVVKTTSHVASRIDLAKLVVDEIVLMGSRCGGIGLALEVLTAGTIDVTPLIQATYPLSRFPEAFREAKKPLALKVLLDPAA